MREYPDMDDKKKEMRAHLGLEEEEGLWREGELTAEEIGDARIQCFESGENRGWVSIWRLREQELWLGLPNPDYKEVLHVPEIDDTRWCFVRFPLECWWRGRPDCGDLRPLGASVEFISVKQAVKWFEKNGHQLPADLSSSHYQVEELSDLVRKRDLELADEETRTEEIAEKNRTRLKVREAANKVVRSLPETPIKQSDSGTLQKESMRFAMALWELGSLWSQYPGPNAHNERAIPDEGLGIESGYRLLDLACTGAVMTTLKRSIIRFRSVLGEHNEHQRSNPADFEDGIWDFFRQIARFFDGEAWVPPLHIGRQYIRNPTISTRGFTHKSDDLNRAQGQSNGDSAKAIAPTEHSSDFSSISWRGKTFKFNSTQAEVIKFLWPEALEKRGLREQTIGDRLMSNATPFRLRNTFKRAGIMHEAWESFVVKLAPNLFSLDL